MMKVNCNEPQPGGSRGLVAGIYGRPRKKVSAPVLHCLQATGRKWACRESRQDRRHASVVTKRSS